MSSVAMSASARHAARTDSPPLDVFPRSGPMRSKLPKFARTRANPGSANIETISTVVWPNAIFLSQFLTGIGHLWTDDGKQFGPYLARTRPELGRNRPNLGRIRMHRPGFKQDSVTRGGTIFTLEPSSSNLTYMLT